MTFGINVKSEDSEVQLSSEFPSYLCIFSGVVTDRNINTGVILGDDVIVTTGLSSSSGLAETGGGLYASGLRSFGTNRVLIFRRSDKINAPPDKYGVQVMSSDGHMTFTSGRHMLLFAKQPVIAGSGIIHQGSGARSIPLPGTSEHVVLAMALSCDINGKVNLHTVGEIYRGYGKLTINFSTTPVLVDISNIPQNYSTGDISGI